MISGNHILLVLPDSSTAQLIERTVLLPGGYRATWSDNCHTAENLLNELQPDLVIVGEQLVDGDYQRLVSYSKEAFPTLPIILFANDNSNSLPLKAMRGGLTDCLIPPLRPEEVLDAVQRGLERASAWDRWARRELRRTTRSLRRRVDALETLARLGRSVTARLDLDQVLTAAVEAAVELTSAEQGSLLLLDERSGELYMRAARNFQDDFVKTFRLPVEDTLAGQVVQTGKPMVLDKDTPEKIKTAYLVRNLIYVPIQLHDQVIGVLGVDNQQSDQSFNEDHVTLLSAIADYAAVAIQNARLYEHTEIERKKLEAILTQIEDGVIVIDPESRLVLVNHIARQAFGLGEQDLGGMSVEEGLPSDDLLSAIRQADRRPYHIELELDGGRVFNAQITTINGVGQAITMQNITHFKELDRIKSDFVRTVSHDLRSPLTAILGYVELIERAGPINEQQQEFIRRVQISVKNISELINELLDLGRIEAGFDMQREMVPIPVIVNYAIDGLRHQLEKKNHQIHVHFEDTVPPILANAIRLRQLFDNLLENAIKYTPPEGEIHLRTRFEEGQVIIEVQDNGLGIPPSEQAYIFDKLYRASNVPPESSGTGLGLSIVKSIVESHQGRIWVDSSPDAGTTFTVVLPVNI